MLCAPLASCPVHGVASDQCTMAQPLQRPTAANDSHERGVPQAWGCKQIVICTTKRNNMRQVTSLSRQAACRKRHGHEAGPGSLRMHTQSNSMPLPPSARPCPRIITQCTGRVAVGPDPVRGEQRVTTSLPDGASAPMVTQCVAAISTSAAITMPSTAIKQQRLKPVLNPGMACRDAA